MSSQFGEIEMKIELGHRAILRKQTTPDGYTHDWEMFVRGPECCNIQHFVEKIVFHLHPSFSKPKRVLKEPPYQVSESGYAGFNVLIDIHFRNKSEPRKLTFQYDLFLRMDEPVNHIRCEKLTFQNPNEDFRHKLLQSGGSHRISSSGNDSRNESVTTKTASPLTLAPVKPTKPLTPETKQFHDLFGPPDHVTIKPKQKKSEKKEEAVKTSKPASNDVHRKSSLSSHSSHKSSKKKSSTESTSSSQHHTSSNTSSSSSSKQKKDQASSKHSLSSKHKSHEKDQQSSSSKVKDKGSTSSNSKPSSEKPAVDDSRNSNHYKHSSSNSKHALPAIQQGSHEKRVSKEHTSQSNHANKEHTSQSNHANKEHTSQSNHANKEHTSQSNHMKEKEKPEKHSSSSSGKKSKSKRPVDEVVQYDYDSETSSSKKRKKKHKEERKDKGKNAEKERDYETSKKEENKHSDTVKNSNEIKKSVDKVSSKASKKSEKDRDKPVEKDKNKSSKHQPSAPEKVAEIKSKKESDTVKNKYGKSKKRKKDKDWNSDSDSDSSLKSPIKKKKKESSKKSKSGSISTSSSKDHSWKHIYSSSDEDDRSVSDSSREDNVELSELSESEHDVTPHHTSEKHKSNNSKKSDKIDIRSLGLESNSDSDSVGERDFVKKTSKKRSGIISDDSNDSQPPAVKVKKSKLESSTKSKTIPKKAVAPMKFDDDLFSKDLSDDSYEGNIQENKAPPMEHGDSRAASELFSPVERKGSPGFSRSVHESQQYISPAKFKSPEAEINQSYGKSAESKFSSRNASHKLFQNDGNSQSDASSQSEKKVSPQNTGVQVATHRETVDKEGHYSRGTIIANKSPAAHVNKAGDSSFSSSESGSSSENDANVSDDTEGSVNTDGDDGETSDHMMKSDDDDCEKQQVRMVVDQDSIRHVIQNSNTSQEVKPFFQKSYSQESQVFTEVKKLELPGDAKVVQSKPDNLDKAPNGEHLSGLLDLQRKIYLLAFHSNKEYISKVIQIIMDSECYVIKKKEQTFDFDLCQVDIDTLNKIKLYLTSIS